MKNATLFIALALLLAGSMSAEAQIVLTSDDLPFQPGSGPYTVVSTGDEDGTNTDAIDALVALSGGNQTYDLTTITYEFSYSGTFTVTEGATGPGASIAPLNQATLTSLTPLIFEEEGSMIDGLVYSYERVTDTGAFNMGAYFEGTIDGDPYQFTTTNEPDGEQHYVFPLAFGSTWSSAFTQTLDFSDFEFESEVEQAYEVDGWGTMIVPGVETPIPVLRVKITETRIIFGFPSTSVCYELRAEVPVVAAFCGSDQTGKGASASVARIGFDPTDAEDGAAPSAQRLEPVHPNPARDRVTLTYTMPTAGAVELVVYDVLGRAVYRVARGAQAAGRHGETMDVSGLAPGVYVARLTIDGQHWTRRLTVAR